jgi:hypothetical protein
MIITGDLPLKYLTKPEAMLALYEQVQAHPSDVYIRENGRSFCVHEETPGAHVPSRVRSKCIRFYGQGPQTVRSQIVEESTVT